MIKNNESIVLITNKNKKYYLDRGYNCLVGDYISVDVTNMPKMSHNLVMAICDICYVEREIPFSKYNQNYKRQNFYSCKGCSSTKRKKTVLESYGVENIFQREEMKEISRNWMKSDEFKMKSKDTQIEKYGSLYTKTDQFKTDMSKKQIDIIRDKKLKGKYFTFLSSSENSELKKRGMFEKYGASFSFHVPEIKNKIQKVNLDKFGHISPFGSDEIQKKIKENNTYKILEKEWSFNGDLYKVNQFKIYRRKVRYETDLIRKKLFENWDGYDYYDGEYIMDNINKNKNDNDYPSIDHKISCFYGFMNDIPTKEISKLDNLCITKRIINSRKSQLTEIEFMKIINSIT